MSPCLILCRHGNTFSKGEKVVMIGAREDLPLTEEGITQAQVIGRALNSAQVRLSRVVSGPLQRTTVFADRVVSELEGRLPIEIDPRLTELDYGAWSGLSDVEIKERFGEVAFTRWQELSERPSMVEFAPPAAQVEAEISSLLSEFSAQEGISLVVTSNGRLREFGRLALDQKAVRSKGFKMKTGNASLLQFHDGAWRVIAWDLQPEGLVEVLASLSP